MDTVFGIWLLASMIFIIISCVAFLVDGKANHAAWELVTRRIIMSAIWPIIMLCWFIYVIIFTDTKKVRAALGYKDP